MPPEIDDSKPKTEQPPLIDFYSFNQGSINMSEKSAAGNMAKPGASIELTDPFSYHQGLSSLAKAIGGASANRTNDEQKVNGKDAAAPGTPDNVECVNGKCRTLSAEEVAAKKARLASGDKSAQGNATHVLPNPFAFHQGDNTPGKPPAPFVPPADVRPLPPPDLAVKPAQPGDLRPKPGDRPGDISNPLAQPGSGKSPIVDAYDRRQGARHAGAGTLPAIDAIPGPNDLTPPSPGPGPGPRPDVVPWTPPRPDANPGPKPDIAPWTPPKPDVDPNVKPADFRPDRNELINKLEPKYETNDVATAVKMAKDTGLPLAVHIGASWCGYCVQMEQNTWPGVEGSANRKGSMQGKVVVLHMDVDQAQSLRGEDSKFANEILKNRGGSVPLLRVFKVDESGNLTKTAENHGAINSKSGLEAFLIKGGVQR